MLSKLFMFCGGLGGAAGVTLGALTAHALAQRLDAAALATLDTVSRYLMVHAALLVVIALWARTSAATGWLELAGGLLVLGMIFFCGGLSISALSGVRQFAAGAPLGGMALIAGWLVLAAYALAKL